MKALGIALLCVFCIVVQSAHAAQKRSKKVLRQFVQVQACPSTWQHRLPCPGFHIDHITPLCAGGADAVDNLQWLTREAHKEKTRGDVGHCAALRRK